MLSKSLPFFKSCSKTLYDFVCSTIPDVISSNGSQEAWDFGLRNFYQYRLFVGFLWIFFCSDISSFCQHSRSITFFPFYSTCRLLFSFNPFWIMSKVNKVRCEKHNRLDTVSLEKNYRAETSRNIFNSIFSKLIEHTSYTTFYLLNNIMSKCDILEMITCAGRSARFN